MLRTRFLRDLTASTAFFTMMLVEEKGHRRSTLRYLWEALREHPGHADTKALLDDMRSQADFLRPYDLVNRLLLRHDGLETDWRWWATVVFVVVLRSFRMPMISWPI